MEEKSISIALESWFVQNNSNKLFREGDCSNSYARTENGKEKEWVWVGGKLLKESEKAIMLKVYEPIWVPKSLIDDYDANFEISLN